VVRKMTPAKLNADVKTSPARSVTSPLLARLLGLPPRLTADVAVERDLAVPMPDRTAQLADRWHRIDGGGDADPVMLVRTPYGRRPLGPIARLFAERGCQVVVASCRGTFGSGGTFDPLRDEAADGQATLAWLAAQPWNPGTVVTWGASYAGLTQWAIARGRPAQVAAAALTSSAADARSTMVYPGDVFALDLAAFWSWSIHQQEQIGGSWLRQIAGQRRKAKVLADVLGTLPLQAVDERLFGAKAPWYQDWLAHPDPGDPWWDQVIYTGDAAGMAPASLVAGWYDIFLPHQLADFQRLRAAGNPARITVGPWHHGSPGMFRASLRDAVDWFGHRLRGLGTAHPEPVRIFVQGSKRWIGLPDWPPPADVQRWHLHPHGRLAPAPPPSEGADRYRYDPADPTPAAGGVSHVRQPYAGSKNNAAREARADVLIYSSEVLAGDLTVVGPVRAELWVRPSLDHTDLFVRLCDVDPKGRSWNRSDGIVRLRPQAARREIDRTMRAVVELWPTATTFRRGHRLRLQVSSGAHPVYARNLGTGEPPGQATTMRAADIEVLRSPARPSAVQLPVVAFPGTDPRPPGRA
jgi:uncharacterized protein